MGLRIDVAVIASALALACSCGSPQPAGDGSLSVVVSNSKSFDPRAQHGRVERYVVKIEGDGIADPILAEFSGEASEGVVEGVPAGDRRTVSVTAINPNGATIRAGETPGVSVGDGMTEVSVDMQAVPIFTNLADGAILDNTRLVFRIFSDPGHPGQRRFSVRDVATGRATFVNLRLLDGSARRPAPVYAAGLAHAAAGARAGGIVAKQPGR